MFDLPVITSENRREYRRFRKYLIKEGFIMMQESVYSKLALNATVASAVINNVIKHKPNDGLVQLFTLTEKQFSKIVFITGSKKSEVLETDERLVIL